jgi:hypothetical protein
MITNAFKKQTVRIDGWSASPSFLGLVCGGEPIDQLNQRDKASVLTYHEDCLLIVGCCNPNDTGLSQARASPQLAFLFMTRPHLIHISLKGVPTHETVFCGL